MRRTMTILVGALALLATACGGDITEDEFKDQLTEDGLVTDEQAQCIVDGLGEAGISLQSVTDEELAYLERVAELFGFSELVFRRLKATHLGAGADDPYAVLGAPHDATDDQLRAAWKIALIENHPDRARSRGLPQEFIEVAEAKAKAINAAFEAAMRERREMALVGAV